MLKRGTWASIVTATGVSTSTLARLAKRIKIEKTIEKIVRKIKPLYAE